MGQKQRTRKIQLPKEELEQAKKMTIEDHIEFLMDPDLKELLKEQPEKLELLISIQNMRNVNRLRNMFLHIT